MGARPAQRPAPLAPGDRHAPDDSPLRPAAAHPPARWPGGRDDRRHRRLQRGQLPRLSVLRPGQSCGAAHGVEPGARTRRLRLHCCRAHTGLDALGDDARGLRCHRGNWRDVLDRPFEPPYPDPGHFGISETPRFTGRAVVALAADPHVARWNQASLSSGQLAREYGFVDLDGSAPDAWRYIVEVQDPGKPADTARYR